MYVPLKKTLTGAIALTGTRKSFCVPKNPPFFSIIAKSYENVISTEGALRLPKIYDNHPNPIPSIRPTCNSE